MRRVSRFLLLLSIGGGVAAPAMADERLAMPYVCGLEGGEVRLVPAAETKYPILGERDEQAITVCNPAASVDCRTIMVHRFTISCGGTGVAWMRVAAAVQQMGNKRAWIDDGRLNVVLPSRDPPPARSECLNQTVDAGNSGLERRVLLKQDCLPWSRRSQIDHVVLPPGYAPIGELGARLVLDSPGEVGIQVANVDPDAVWEPSLELEPYREGVESAAAGNDWVTVVQSETEYGRAVRRGDSGIPWDWTWLFSAMLVATAAVVVRVRYPQALPAFSAAGALRRRSTIAQPSHGGKVVAALLERTEGIVKGLKGAGALREVLQSELDRVHRNLANVEAAAKDTCEGSEEHKARSAPLYRALVRDLERIGRIAESAAASFSGAQRSAVLPRTKSEAYDVLGVNADVSEAVLKKIADALRMSWHPDHARDEDDRMLREERIRQINAAWELIAEKRETN